MNSADRKQTAKILKAIEAERDKLDALREDILERYERIPESLGETTGAMKLEAEAEKLEEAVQALDEALTYLEELPNIGE